MAYGVDLAVVARYGVDDVDDVEGSGWDMTVVVVVVSVDYVL